MLHYLIIGTVLGLSAGFTPGPLLTLVISETLQHNIKSGIKVSIAPIITDLPIIGITLFILSKLSNFHIMIGVISLIGAVFVLFMGYESIRSKGIDLSISEIEPKSLRRGAIVNVFSPHPYLFWLAVGAPTMTKAISLCLGASLAFIISFYFFLVGAKIGLAVLTSKSKSFLKGNKYIYTLRFFGFVLCIFSFILFYDGLKLLEII